MVIVAGVTKRAIHPLKKASARISTIGIASGQRVKRSTQVSKYLKPSAYGSGPTISLGRFGEFAENWLIVTRNVGGLTAFAGTAPFGDIYVHSMPYKSRIYQRLGSSM